MLGDCAWWAAISRSGLSSNTFGRPCVLRTHVSWPRHTCVLARTHGQDTCVLTRVACVKCPRICSVNCLEICRILCYQEILAQVLPEQCCTLNLGVGESAGIFHWQTCPSYSDFMLSRNSCPIAPGAGLHSKPGCWGKCWNFPEAN